MSTFTEGSGSAFNRRDLIERLRLYREAVDPLRRQLISIMALAPPRPIVLKSEADGTLTLLPHDDSWMSPELRKLQEMLLEEMQQVARAYGLREPNHEQRPARSASDADLTG